MPQEITRIADELRERVFRSARKLQAKTVGRSLTGYVDQVRPRVLAGWACDAAAWEKRLTVDLFAGDQLLATAVADQYRQDVRRAGFGDGRYGFAIALPDVPAPQRLTVSVVIRGSQVRLPFNGNSIFEIDLTPTPFLDTVALDIVNNCNLRCPFCLVDYSKVRNTRLMSTETFQRFLKFIDHVGESGFWLSCLHEPTLNPKLNQFLDMLPDHRRKNVMFTSNLARPLDEATFEGWANSRIHHVNVSLDTLNPQLFPILRKFGRFEVFERNLDLMASVFRRIPHAPKIRYITMAFKSNFDEITEIVRVSNERWLSSENEIRYTYNFQHINDEFRHTQYLHREDWPILDDRLSKLPYNYIVGPPPAEYEDHLQATTNYELLNPLGLPRKGSLQRPMQLRARPDGNVLIIGHENEYGVNIHSVDDPIALFRSFLAEPQAAPVAASA